MNRKERRAARSRGAGGGTTGSTEALFAQVVRDHRLGRFFEAEAGCRTILALDPSHLGALHLLGILAQSRGAHEEAAARFRSAIGVRPEIAALHYSLGRALAETGRLEEAVNAFERARAIDAGSPPQPGVPAPDYARTYLNLGNLSMERGRLDEAEALYRRALSLNSGFGEANSNLGALLLAQGKLAEAAAQFVRALELAPVLVDLVANMVATLYRLNPPLGEAVKRAAAAWPRLPPEHELLGAGEMAAITGDLLLRRVLELITVRDMELERFLTALRRALLERATGGGDADEATLRLACALARQCFINEYAFAIAPEEAARADALKAERNLSALQVAALASYLPLHTLPDAQSLLGRDWPEPVAALLTQQIREVTAERELAAGMARLTPIGDGVSQQVREQYEENPYPRWVVAPTGTGALSLEEHLRRIFPAAPLRAPAGSADILIAGCGTGQHSLGIARSVRAGRVLAIDLSLASLSYALRKTREIGVTNIEYAQADILKLGSLGRSFDMVDASGSLQALADPFAGWTVLLSLVRPGGFMRIGLYSELARRDIVAAQRFAAERGFRPTADDMRRLRQELMDTPLRTITRFHDFFSLSECRDLLLHVQEVRHTIPQIRSFLRSQSLDFIGFELDAVLQQTYRAAFPQDATMTSLDHWHAFETSHPDTFAGMYQFWVQRR